ncbi:MAG: hypothetical protein BM557_06705 [Flavobacterium sp. MedPE-SWcel]|uniref:site-specific integrase n=1 Tax=uncultured Flavobacterium sp. TaxID=165435 RepID=UPI000917A4CB|nr:site-specific integrase [uncultured Flavobacterium sp.]OIQ18610.1 MAG: hypothetical protein BM557_06705 [Flavobacterium sp. MedPE-SWcel]
MLEITNLYDNVPNSVPMKFTGKLNTRIVIRTDQKCADGTHTLYLQLFLNKQRKKISCNISVHEKDFDKEKQRIRRSCKSYKDYNLLLEKILADINKIEVAYRLSDQVLTMDKLLEEFHNPTSKIDFVHFWEAEMQRQKELLKPGTYRQQVTMLNKLKSYKKTWYFYEITEETLQDAVAYFKNKLKNKETTINSFLKSFKKYLHIAQKRGIRCPLAFDDIHPRQPRGERTFLMPDELQNLNNYFDDPYCNKTHKIILSKFLFSCFTGLRFSDVANLDENNFMNDVLLFCAEKTNKIQRIPLNKPAQKFANPEYLFAENFTNEYINRELKEICIFRGIRKRVSFHVARHTFATNFLLAGGRVEHLQKLLNHSQIRETMIYVHIVENITNEQIHNMNEIIKL